MLRQPPTLISLSKKDVKEHFENISRNTRVARCEGVAEHYNPRPPLQSYTNHEPIATVEGSREIYWNSRSSQSSSSSRSATPEADRGQPQFQDVSFDSRDTTVAGSVETTRITVSGLRASLPSLPENRLISVAESELTDTEDGHISIGFPPSDDVDEHVQSIQQLAAQELETHRASSPLVPAFDYGGFVESTSRDSSSFVPEDVSTPQGARLSNLQRLRTRIPLPRSPLFRSYDNRQSPEQFATVGLMSRLASPGTPSTLFSQAARRPRNYRARTLSYTYEESERASAIYEDITASPSNSQNGLMQAAAEQALREIFRDSSFQSSDEEISLPSSPPEYGVDINLRSTSGGIVVADAGKTPGFSSPSLQVPPPFSTVPRNGSAVAPFPSGSSDDTRRSARRSPRGQADNTGSPSLDTRASNETPEGREVHRSPSSTSTARSIASIPLRFLSAYRARSPIGPWPRSNRASETPQPGSRERRNTSPVLPVDPPNTPYRRLRVYDDRMPAILQPQTPQHLPEARHQSHYHPSYTAPVNGRSHIRREPASNFRRGRGTRSDSPLGLDAPGLTGLYSGQENAEVEVMFARAAQRLFLRREDGRNNDRSGSNTPEREISMGEAQ